MIKNTTKGLFLCMIGLASYAYADAPEPMMRSGGSSMFDGIHARAGVGAIMFEKFKRVPSAYDKKAPKTAPIFNLGVGYMITDDFRADLNLQYTKVEYKATGATNGITATTKQDIKSFAVFLNGYYDINFHKYLVPYGTVGIGIGFNDAGNLKDSVFGTAKGKSDTNFVWNIGAGVKFNVHSNVAIDVGYKYMDLGRFKTEASGFYNIGGSKQRIKGHQIMGSLIYKF